MKKTLISFLSFTLLLFSLYGFTKPVMKPSISSKVAGYGNLRDILRSFDPSILQGDDSEASTNLIASKNSEIIEYAVANYPELHAEELNPNDSTVALYGMLLSLAEETEFQNLSEEQLEEMRANPDYLGCLTSTVAGLIGIKDIKAILADFSSGVSATTIVGTLKTMLRRVAWGWTIGITIFQFGDCIGWW